MSRRFPDFEKFKGVCKSPKKIFLYIPEMRSENECALCGYFIPKGNPAQRVLLGRSDVWYIHKICFDKMDNHPDLYLKSNLEEMFLRVKKDDFIEKFNIKQDKVEKPIIKKKIKIKNF